MPAIHQEQFNRKKVRFISLISFLFGFSQAVLIYVMSYYFKLASGTENVGLFYLVAYSVLLLVLLNLHKIFKFLGKSSVLFFSIIIKIISALFLVMLPPSFWTIIIMVFYMIGSMLEWVAIDVILESFSKDRMSGRIRGMYLTVMNTGFLVGPFLSTRILEKFNFQGIFVFLLIINSLILIISLMELRHVNHKFEKKESVWQLVKKVSKRKNIMRIFWISFTLEFFYALVVIYTPLYLRDLGASWGEIGIVFTIMLIPFVILQYPAGVLADKKMGEKELLIVAIAIMSVSTGVIYFISTPAILAWAVVLFATRIGAALIEILRDSYFYKRIDGRDVDLINFFRTSVPAAYISATFLSFVLLLFFPVKAVFLLVAVAVFAALYPALRLKDNKCEGEICR